MCYKIRGGIEGLFRPTPVERTDGKIVVLTLASGEGLFGKRAMCPIAEIFSPDEGEKSQLYFVYSKILRQNMAEGKRSAIGHVDVFQTSPNMGK